MMKLVITFCLLISLCSNAQMEYFVGYNGSILIEGINLNNLTLSNTLSFTAKKNKTIFSLGIGREDWKYDYFLRSDSKSPAARNYHSSTFKIVPKIEREFAIADTKLSIIIGLGGKFYFVNQLKDSLSSKNIQNEFSNVRPSKLLIKGPNVDYTYMKEFDLITKMPLAILGSFAVHYRYKKCNFKLYYEPSFVLVKSKNAFDFSKERTRLFFYNDIGVGLNYQINFKKKEKNSTTNQ